MRTRTILTERDRAILRLLGRARWLSTEQIQRSFFLTASSNAVSKRLRKLVETGYLHGVRRGRTELNYYRATSSGLQMASYTEPFRVPHFPTQIEHFRSINDVRLWFQLNSEAESVRAEWEYRSFHTSGTLIPDALVTFRKSGETNHLAIEVDGATENAHVLAKKLARYAAWDRTRNLAGVIVYAPGPSRIRSVVSSCFRLGHATGLRCWLTDILRLWSANGNSRCFLDLASAVDGHSIAMENLPGVLGSPFELSCRGEGCTSATSWATVGYTTVSSPKYERGQKGTRP